MFSTLRTRALLTLTGLAAIGGLVALPGTAAAAPAPTTCTSPNAAANMVDATATSGLIKTFASTGVHTYEYGNSPYIGARYNKCLRELKVYYGGYDKNVTHYNIRFYDGRQIEVKGFENGVWTPKNVSPNDPGYHFSVQACNRGTTGKSVCSAWSPTIGLTGAY